MEGPGCKYQVRGWEKIGGKQEVERVAHINTHTRGQPQNVQ